MSTKYKYKTRFFLSYIENGFCLYDNQGNRTRKVVVKNNVREERYYINGYEIFRKYVSDVLDFERKTINISDDEKVFARIEQKDNESEITRYQYDNHLGSACLELDENGDIISYEEYHPFGTTSYKAGRTETEVSQKRYKYNGKERDEETGLYAYGMRYYAAWLCRFVSADPLQFKYPELTPFQYASNRPITMIDLDGAEGVEPNDTTRSFTYAPPSETAPMDAIKSQNTPILPNVSFEFDPKGVTDAGDLRWNINIQYAEERCAELQRKYGNKNGDIYSVETYAGTEGVTYAKIIATSPNGEKSDWGACEDNTKQGRWGYYRTAIEIFDAKWEGHDNGANQRVGDKSDVIAAVATVAVLVTGGLALAYAPEIAVGLGTAAAYTESAVTVIESTAITVQNSTGWGAAVIGGVTGYIQSELPQDAPTISISPEADLWSKAVQTIMNAVKIYE